MSLISRILLHIYIYTFAYKSIANWGNIQFLFFYRPSFGMIVWMISICPVDIVTNHDGRRNLEGRMVTPCFQASFDVNES